LTSRRLVPFGILFRYIARSLVRPYFLGFAVVTFLLTLELLLDSLDMILSKGIPVWMVARLFVLGLGWMVVLSVPCGILVAALMTYGRMSQDNEITALRASGVNLASVMLPSLFVSIAVAAGLAGFNNYVLPETNHAFANLWADIQRIRPTSQIQEGIFIDEFEGYNLFIRSLDERSGEMTGVLIIDSTQNRSSPRTIIAQRGHLRFLDEQNTISLDLQDGEIHDADPGDPAGRYHVLAFNQDVMVLKGTSEALAKASTRSRSDREMSAGQMKEQVRKLDVDLKQAQADIDSSLTRLGVAGIRDLPDIHPQKPKTGFLGKGIAAIGSALSGHHPRPPASPDLPQQDRRKIENIEIQIDQAEGIRKRMDRYRVEIEKKLSIPFACIVFVLVGAPLGMRARRGGLAAGFLSVGFFLFYYLCLIAGEQLADREIMSPWLAMWLPNIVLGLWGGYLTQRVISSGSTAPAAGRGTR
jgi:lipopolysaccharide export system permease protein